MENLKKNLLTIQEKIAPYNPTIIAVTKYFDETKLIEAYDLGLRNFGESRVLDAIAKIERLPNDIRKNSTFHLIGHLQSNKVKYAIGNFAYIHSVDSLKLAIAINEQAEKLKVIQKVFLQVNNADEKQKFGFSKKDLTDVLEQILSLKNLKVVGLMNIAPINLKEDELKKLFEDIFDFRNELEKRFHCKLSELSMGMSEDYDIAVKAGATMIRVGRKLFS